MNNTGIGSYKMEVKLILRGSRNSEEVFPFAVILFCGQKQQVEGNVP